MTTNDPIVKEKREAEGPREQPGATKTSSADEQPMSKPSMIWMLIPVALIALAMFLAR